MTAPAPDVERGPLAGVASWPQGHPDEDAHAALLQLLEELLGAGCIIPCITAAPEDNPWLVDGTGSAVARAQRAAADACQDCPALDECRAYALAAGESGGVWGGTTAVDRAPSRRRPPGRPRRKAAA